MSYSSIGYALQDVDIREVSEKVPPEYLLGWEWFEKHGGRRIGRLPFGKGRPQGMPMPLARQAAIHCPSYPSLPSKGAGKKRYALSVYSVGQAVYPDGKKSERSDGTWILEYHEQRGGDPNQNYNELLLNCMKDGVPIGVMVKSPLGGYEVLGLAVVEGYDSRSRMFILHGPLSLGQSKETISTVEHEPVSPVKRHASPSLPKLMMNASTRPNADEYQQFWRLVFDAYEGACAVTETAVPEILDAAFVDQFTGPESLVVSNGLLLRCDICRLYDADLLCIEPENYSLRVGSRLSGTSYMRLDGCEVRSPRDSLNAPEVSLIERRYQRFLSYEENVG